MLGKIEVKRIRGWQRIRWLDSITDSMDMNLSKFQEIEQTQGAWHAAVCGVQRVGHDLMTEQQLFKGGSMRSRAFTFLNWRVSSLSGDRKEPNRGRH